MTAPAEDEDMKSAVNELGSALSAAMLGASPSDVQRVINAISDVMDVKIAQFIELMVDRSEELRRRVEGTK